MSCAIEFEHISKSYTPEEVVLRDINLSIEDGQFVVLLGSSGCGKTTLLKMVNKLLDFDTGYLRIHGKKLSDWNIEALRRSIGYAIQQVGLFPHLRVWENISYVLKLQGVGKDERKMRALELVDLVGLKAEHLDRYPRQLSGGQRQRVGVARALAADPSIILMDEPFGAVDEQTRSQLQDQLKRIHRQFGQTILFVTHDIHEAFRLADRIVLIHEGTILQDGSPVDLVFHPRDEAVSTFLGKRGFSALLDQMVMDKLYTRLQAGTLDVDLLVSQLKGDTPSAF
ncbi:MAG: ABC transporter ATP-binding protein [Sphaerochaeta sp.]|nr:ABC transporter ATP-binding protein [Sphaerochaeta sp.]NCC12182.1 ABC transporter ATP-binding protein [Spirochaetia bacterium]NCC89319.1 ABC transporter ATP-binding protein [Spirochaetia bacterium]